MTIPRPTATGAWRFHRRRCDWLSGTRADRGSVIAARGELNDTGRHLNKRGEVPNTELHEDSRAFHELTACTRTGMALVSRQHAEEREFHVVCGFRR